MCFEFELVKGSMGKEYRNADNEKQTINQCGKQDLGVFGDHFVGLMLIFRHYISFARNRKIND